jgi:hypothetical protein
MSGLCKVENGRFHAEYEEAWSRSEIELSAKERKRSKVLHEVEEGRLK